MGLVDGFQLCQVEDIDEPTIVYDKLMKLIVRLARYGIIHGDLNEFNLLIDNEVCIIYQSDSEHQANANSMCTGWPVKKDFYGFYHSNGHNFLSICICCFTFYKL